MGVNRHSWWDGDSRDYPFRVCGRSLKVARPAGLQPATPGLESAKAGQARIQLVFMGEPLFAAFTLPARTIGGDYYDFLDLGRGQVGIAVADVSGKGISAALVMSVVQAFAAGDLVAAERVIVPACDADEWILVSVHWR